MKNKSSPKKIIHQSYEEWFESLPLDKHMFIAQHVKKKLDKIQDETEKILDSCYVGAMIEVLNMNLSDCINIAKKANENMDETLKILSKEGEKYYMKVNSNVLREEIKAEVKALIEDNRKLNNIQIIKILEKDYDLISKDLQILIKEAREELANEALKELEKDINVNEVAADVNIKAPSYAIGEIKATLMSEREHGFEIVTEKAGIKLNEGFKINKIELEKDGRVYVKDSEGVKIEDKVYRNVEEVEKEKEIVYQNLKEQEIKIKKEIEDLNNQLQNVEVKREERIEMYAEIEQIFAM